MEYRKLGRTGLKVSALCLGTMTFRWTSTEQQALRVLDRAYEAGINFIDTADVYSNWAPGNPGGVAERIIGKWLKTKLRHTVVIATKVRGRMWAGPNGEGLSRQHIMLAVEDSLRRLGVETIDLYQTHHPYWDTPLDETLRALDDLVCAGKVRYIGASNYAPGKLMKAIMISQQHGWARFDCLQPEYSLLVRSTEWELLPLCQEEGIGVIAWSPLAGGWLTGKYHRGAPPPPDSRVGRADRWDDLPEQRENELTWRTIDVLR